MGCLWSVYRVNPDAAGGGRFKNLLWQLVYVKVASTRLQENPQRQTQQVLKRPPRSETAGWARQTRAVISTASGVLPTGP